MVSGINEIFWTPSTNGKITRWRHLFESHYRMTIQKSEMQEIEFSETDGQTQEKTDRHTHRKYHIDKQQRRI